MRELETLVVGSGPAGAATAIGLALSGLPVVLIDRARFPRRRIGESLPPKVGALFAQLGVLEAVEAAGFTRMSGTTIKDGDALTVHDFEPERRALGYQAERERLDTLLVERARAVGVEVRPETALIEGRAEEDHFIATLRSAGGDEVLRPRWVVDASGSGVIARAIGLKRKESLRTVALSGYWRGARPLELGPRGNTFFETRADGWTWIIRRADGLTNVTFGADPKAMKGQGSAAYYQALIGQSPWLGALLEEATLEEEPSVLDATWASAERFIGPSWILVGDAASVIDPLTSQGVYKALQSGLAAATVLRTIARWPERGALAERYYQQTQAEFFERYCQTAVTFYRGSRFSAEPFWAARARLETGPSPVDDPAAAERRRTLSEQLAALGGQKLGLRAAPRLRLGEAGVADRGLIVAKPRLFAGEEELELSPEVDHRALLAALGAPSVEACFERYAAEAGLVRSAELGRIILAALLRLAELGLVTATPLASPPREPL